MSPHRQDDYAILGTLSNGAGLEELVASGAQHYDNLKPKGNCYVQQICDQSNKRSDEVKPEQQAEHEYDQLLPSIVRTNRKCMSLHTEDGYYYLDASSNDAGLEELGASDLHHYSSKLDHRDGHYYSKQKGNRKKTVKGDTSNRKISSSTKMNTAMTNCNIYRLYSKNTISCHGSLIDYIYIYI